MSFVKKKQSGFSFINRIYRFPLFNAIASFLLIICLFFSQATEAFLVSALPCAQEHVAISTTQNPEHAKLPMQHLTMQSMQMDCSDSSCCQEASCCSFGLLSLAILVDISIKPNANFKTPSPIDIDTALQTLILTRLQRPPKKHLFS